MSRDRLDGAGHSASGRSRAARVGLAAALLLSCSPVALRAETSIADLERKFAAAEAAHAREIAELKAQLRSMKGDVAETRTETRRVAKTRVAGREPSAVPPISPPSPIPPGSTPVFVTADKRMQFGPVTLTPGGFIAAESVFRSGTTQSDINTGYNSIPFPSSPNAHLNEFRFSARQSRVALLAEGAITPTMLASAYGELDFLAPNASSNETDTNGYSPRIRHLYVTLDANDYGFHFLAGQNWSLLTLNSKGITPRNELPPPTIDGQFIPGFTFARQPGIRLVKDFDKKLWIGLSAEQPSTTFATAACSNVPVNGAAGAPVIVPAGLAGVNAVCASSASGAGFAQYGQNYSFNHVPDVIGKVAYELTLGERDIHLEADGIYKNLYDRTQTALVSGTIAGANRNTTGYGFGGGVIIPILPKRLDFQGSVLAGRGISRYGAGVQPDATINPDGSLRAIGQIQALAGLTLHATPAIDLYVFAGLEKANRAVSNVGTAAAPNYFGYGSPTLNNSGCFTENGTCAGQTQSLFQITGGMWDKIYKGSYGEVRAGIQYSYTRRSLFETQAPGSFVAFTPRANDSFVLTSLRYYPFQ